MEAGRHGSWSTKLSSHLELYAKQRGQLEKAWVFTLSKPISSDIVPLTRPYLPKQCQPLGTTCSNPWISRGPSHSNYYRRICETGNGSDAQNRTGVNVGPGMVWGEIGLERCQKRCDFSASHEEHISMYCVMWWPRFTQIHWQISGVAQQQSFPLAIMGQ